MVRVGGGEVAPPAATESFPEATNLLPDGKRCQRRWLTAHPQVSRQRTAERVERIRCRRIEFKLLTFCTKARNDGEARPTKPGGGKGRFRREVKVNQHPSKSRRQKPPSRKQTRVASDRAR